MVVYTENSGLFGCWGADVRSHLPIKQDCEPFAEGATFRLHALRDGSLGFSFLQIPRSCSESPNNDAQAPGLCLRIELGAVIWCLRQPGLLHSPNVDAMSWGLLYLLTHFYQICSLQKLFLR